MQTWVIVLIKISTINKNIVSKAKQLNKNEINNFLLPSYSDILQFLIDVELSDAFMIKSSILSNTWYIFRQSFKTIWFNMAFI